MTLVIASVTRDHAFHISDRLTTVQSRAKSGSEDWDIRANKTVVVIGLDCWLVIGFTGLAYLDGKPTDQYIAEAISGIDDLSGAGFVGWSAAPDLHYQGMLERVSRAVLAAYTRLPVSHRKHGLTLSAAGVQLTKPRLRQLLVRLDFTSTGVRRSDATDPFQSQWTFNSIPIGSVNAPILDSMRQQLRDHGAESPSRFREILMNAVAETGRVSDVVGEDVMSVLLIPRENKIQILFRPATPGQAIELPRVKQEEADVALREAAKVYTPFALLPGMIFCPAVATPGGWNAGGIQYEILGDETPGRAFYGSHERRSGS
ncbi:MAG TPA: hypothetical protein VJ865_13740 [Gemmatimonadaceae bacterium]|nr:hypothetical protein [Gemmatimonadaceae bacterium]